MISLNCGLPCCHNTPGQQTPWSVSLRASAVALGTIAVIIGILILLEVPGLSRLGTTVGWTTLSLGLVIAVVGASIQCVRNHSDAPRKVLSNSELRIKQFWEEFVQKAKLRHGTHSIYLHHFKTHGISATYPQPLRELIAKIDRIWQRHRDHTLGRTEYFLGCVQRMREAHEQQEIHVSFSMDPSVAQEFTTGARHGGEWARECRTFLQRAHGSWNMFDPEEQETLKKLEALLSLMNALPPMIISIAAEPRYTTFEAFQSDVQEQCPEWHDSVQLEAHLASIREKLDCSNKYEKPVRDPIAPERLEFEILEREPMRVFRGPFLAIGETKLLNSQQIMQHRILRNGFSEHPQYRDSRFVAEPVVSDDYSRFKVTRRALTQEDEVDYTEEMLKRKHTSYWIAQFHCEELVKKYNSFI